MPVNEVDSFKTPLLEFFQVILFVSYLQSHLIKKDNYERIGMDSLTPNLGKTYSCKNITKFRGVKGGMAGLCDKDNFETYGQTFQVET